MTFRNLPCYCEKCRKKYKLETGSEIPTVVDFTKDDWKNFQLWRQNCIGEFAHFCTNELKKLKPEVSVEHQFSTICQPWYRGVDGAVNEASDYSGGDLYGGHLQESYICKIYREATKNQPFEYMTSRCDPELSVHTTTKTADQMRLHNHLTLAQHGAMLFIDAIDPVGTLNPDVYRQIGKVFEETMPLEKYLTGNYVSEAALIMSYDSKFNILQKAESPKNASYENPQLDAQLALAGILKRMHMLYTVLPSDRLTNLKGKKIAFLTNASILRNEEISAIADYVSEGGNLYISGTTDPRLGALLLGMKFNGYTQYNQTYLAPTEAGEKIFEPIYSKKYPLAFHGKQMIASFGQEVKILATTTLPYTDPADATVFASIHSNPPGIPTSDPAMVIGKYGKGKVVWVSCPIEIMNSEASDGVVISAIEQMTKPELLSTNAPGCVEFTLFDDEKNRRMLLHAVNVSEGREILPVYGIKVKLPVPHKVLSIRCIPSLEPIMFSSENTEVSFEIEKLEIARHIMLEY